MIDGLQLAHDIRRAVNDVVKPAVVVVGPNEWAVLLKITGPLNTITDTPDGATMFSLPVYGHRGGGWHVTHVRTPPSDLDGLERLHAGVPQRWTLNHRMMDARTRPDHQRRAAIERVTSYLEAAEQHEGRAVMINCADLRIIIEGITE